jgi:hypothetical protein
MIIKERILTPQDKHILAGYEDDQIKLFFFAKNP